MNTPSIVAELELPEPNTFNFSNVYLKCAGTSTDNIYIFINDEAERVVMRAYSLLNPCIKVIKLNNERCFKVHPHEYAQLFGNMKLLAISPRQQAIREKNDLYRELVKNYF